jgi:hypothetical protein
MIEGILGKQEPGPEIVLFLEQRQPESHWRWISGPEVPMTRSVVDEKFLLIKDREWRKRNRRRKPERECTRIPCSSLQNIRRGRDVLLDLS